MAKLLFIFVLQVHLIFCVFSVDVGVITKSIHIAQHLREKEIPGKIVTYSINHAITQDNVPEFLKGALKNLKHPRNKRQAPSPEGNLSPKTSVFAFNDSHTKMVIHWAGANSDVIVALTKGTNLQAGKTKEASSNVFISNNYGVTFQSINSKLRIANGRQSIIEQYFISPIFNTHYIFTDEVHNYIFRSMDYGASVLPVPVPFRPKTLRLHTSNFQLIMGMDNEDPEKKLFLSNDFGETWREIQRGVKSFYWDDGRSSNMSTNCIYILRITSDDMGNIIRSCDFFSSDVTLLSYVHDFELMGPYMFASRKMQLLGGTGFAHQIFISYYRQQFQMALFPHDLTHLDYYIADVSEDQIFVCVNHDTKSSHMFISKVNSTEFLLSLENILYINPNDTTSKAWIRYYTSEAFADIHKVQGMRGVYIATQLVNRTLASDHQRTLITYDKGGEWQLVVAPKFDHYHKPTNCSVSNNCSLHLSQNFDRLYRGSIASPILSRSSAPGLIMATGVLGTKLHIDNTTGIYVSTDAGYSWVQVLEGFHIFAIADHGGVLVAVLGYQPTNQIVYSTDEGESWHVHNFSTTPLQIYGLLTEPGEKTTVLFLFGSSLEQHSWQVVSINLSTVFRYKCSDRDYKMWSMPDDTPFQGCLLGRMIQFERRIPHTNCYNGRDYDREIQIRNCSCTRDDFECDYGFKPNMLFGSTRCVLDESMNAEVHKIPDPCPEGSFYPYTRGYVKIGGDTCVGGDEHRFAPLMYACRVIEVEEALLYSEQKSIKRLKLTEDTTETILVGENFSPSDIATIDYEYGEKNCLYWANNGIHAIQRLCEDGNHSIEILHNTSISRVEAIAYDWAAKNIYWIDSGYRKLEVSWRDGRYRRELIRGSRYLDNPTSLVLDPHHGYMYWTDSSRVQPRIMRAWMDGSLSSIMVLVNSSMYVSQPVSITLDILTERLYWSDAALGKIFSSSIHGADIQTVVHTGSLDRVNPHAIAIFKNQLLYSDWTVQAIISCNKYDGSENFIVEETNSLVLGLKVLNKHIQSGGNTACSQTMACSQLCLLKPPLSAGHGMNRTCRCSNNATLSVMAIGGDEHCCPHGWTNTSGACQKPNSTCRDDEFTCNNGRCISPSWKCDRDNDCLDHSDEVDCEYETCAEDQFTCKSDGRCIPEPWKCDLDNDCGDSSDEEGCPIPTCAPGQFQCTKGHCINANWTCDFDLDCPDGSDEENCTRNATVCEEDEFTCPRGIPHCVLQQYVCDSSNHCFDGADERNCTGNHTQVCPSWKSKCQNGHCVYRSWWCDGEDDCGDNTDEKMCPNVTTTTPMSTTIAPCGRGHFRCRNGACIQSYEYCDGVNDCGDNSDEPGYNCGHNASHCRSDEFQCARDYQCTPLWNLCNGVADCRDGSDESQCPPTTPGPACHFDEFRCYKSARGCIDDSSVCDGIRDCDNNEDEDPDRCRGSVTCDSAKFFKCRHSVGCIARKDMCNDVYNCPDHSDEEGCGGILPPVKNNTCERNYLFPCLYGKGCVPYMLTCDGNKDCARSSDENLPQCFDVIPQRNTIYEVGHGSTNATYRWTPYHEKNISYIFSYITIHEGHWSWENHTIGNGSTYTMQNLHPAATYFVTVYVKAMGEVKQHYKVVTLKTLDGIPEEPQTVTLMSMPEARAISVHWFAPNVYMGTIIKYRVYIKDAKLGDTAYQFQDTTRAYTNTLTLTSVGNILLDPGKNYTVVVSAFTSMGEGKLSKPVSIVYGSKRITSSVTNLVGKLKGNNSVSLTWSAPDSKKDKVDSYIVEYHDLWGNKYTYTTEKTQYEVDHLCPGTSYSFGVAANSKNLGPGPRQYITLKTNGSEVKVPQSLTLKLVDITSVKVTWQPPAGVSKAENYTVFYDFHSMSMHDSKVIDSADSKNTTTNYTIISDLQACEGYYFRVAVTGSGKCRLSPQEFIQTSADEKSAPKYLKFAHLSKTSGNITWQSSCPFDVIPTGYVIHRKNNDTGKVLQTQPYIKTNSTLLSMVYKNLIPGATYIFTIQNTNKGAKMSLPLTVVMDPYDAPELLTLAFTTMMGDSGILSWRNASAQVEIGNFTGYEVLLCSSKVNEHDCSDENSFKHYTETYNLTVAYTGLPPGYTHVFKVRLNKVNGYYGKMSNPVEVPAEAVPPTNTNNPLSRTNLIAIGVSVGVVIIVLVSLLTCFIVRHRRLQRSFHAFASSHYDSRSGTTTFSAADELEEEDSPMIRGFSDDEPLVIA